MPRIWGKQGGRCNAGSTRLLKNIISWEISVLPRKCQMLLRNDKVLCSDALAKDSSLRTQTDGSPALPTESTLLAIGIESTANPPPHTPTKKKKVTSPRHPESPSSTYSHICIPALVSGVLSKYPVSALRLPNPGFLGAPLKPLEGKKVKILLNLISRLPGIFSPQRK